MKIPFANNSYAELQYCSYEMNYGFTTKSYQETGLHLHLTPQDAKNPINTFQAATKPGSSVSADARIQNTIQAFLAFITPNSGKLVCNTDGTLDVVVLPHALQIGSTNAFDPNPLFPAYGNVKQQVLQLNPSGPNANFSSYETVQIPAGTQSVAHHFQVGSFPGNSDADTNAKAVAGVYKCVFPGIQVPAFSPIVADFSAFILGEVRRNINPGAPTNLPKRPGAGWLGSADAQSTLRGIEQNGSRYQGACSQICAQWKAVAESLGTNRPLWPVTAPGEGAAYATATHSSTNTARPNPMSTMID